MGFPGEDWYGRPWTGNARLGKARTGWAPRGPGCILFGLKEQTMDLVSRGSLAPFAERSLEYELSATTVMEEGLWYELPGTGVEVKVEPREKSAHFTGLTYRLVKNWASPGYQELVREAARYAADKGGWCDAVNYGLRNLGVGPLTKLVSCNFTATFGAGYRYWDSEGDGDEVVPVELYGAEDQLNRRNRYLSDRESRDSSWGGGSDDWKLLRNNKALVRDKLEQTFNCEWSEAPDLNDGDSSHPAIWINLDTLEFPDGEDDADVFRVSGRALNVGRDWNGNVAHGLAIELSGMRYRPLFVDSHDLEIEDVTDRFVGDWAVVPPGKMDAFGDD